MIGNIGKIGIEIFSKYFLNFYLYLSMCVCLLSDTHTDLAVCLALLNFYKFKKGHHDGKYAGSTYSSPFIANPQPQSYPHYLTQASSTPAGSQFLPTTPQEKCADTLSCKREKSDRMQQWAITQNCFYLVKSLFAWLYTLDRI